ncbi:hypothetical protein EVAR_48312_1 [Eumeta japonica]|uniref:Uncharacterized protein n=1 Tax=Eumeta variegata TaxID=151549 RepID=A0A4C1WN06_EUMVA|nr:hypothetical protein EVAR_48312_1 [Eumeta japonica]
MTEIRNDIGLSLDQDRSWNKSGTVIGIENERIDNESSTEIRMEDGIVKDGITGIFTVTSNTDARGGCSRHQQRGPAAHWPCNERSL